MKVLCSLQAEGSSFLQMGASLEQQVVCMFKVQNALHCQRSSNFIWTVFKGEKFKFCCQRGPLRLINTMWEHPDSLWGKPWSGILAWLLQTNTVCLYGRLYCKFSWDDVFSGIISARSVVTLSHNLMEANPNSLSSVWLFSPVSG